jgi:mannosyltransferase OCH1-like enzyme
MTESQDHHRQRSEFIRMLVQRPKVEAHVGEMNLRETPKTIVQFWHDLDELPPDVGECIASWSRWARYGYHHHLFDASAAMAFIRASLKTRHVRAFERCYHPAMQADYFRLCYVFVEGGCYVDADDICVGPQIDWLFFDGRLKVQPLCYDKASQTMVSRAEFLHVDAFNPSWIFYFNNNPLIAHSGHPIIECCLEQATALLEGIDDFDLPEIQATTGPGNLSRTIFELGKVRNLESDLLVLRDWETLACAKWPLSYRDDVRNWRHSNQRRFVTTTKSHD